MKSRAIAVALLIGVAVANTDLFACGDKFLALGRGTRYERSPAARRMSAILVFANPAAPLARTLATLSVDATLQKAGYKPRIVASEAELDTALRGNKWDLVVVDGTDGLAVSRRLQGLHSNDAPRLVPLLHDPTSADLKDAKKTFPAAVKAPAKSQAFLDTIDDAMDRLVADAKTAAKKATH